MARRRGDSERKIELEGEVRHETDAAWLFWVEDADEEIWFPKSQCEVSGDESSIMVPMWLVRAKGLE